MSVCIYRHKGAPPTCGEDKKPCGWWRAAWCVPWDMIKFVFGAVRNMWLRAGE